MERTGRECGLGRTQDWGFSILQPIEWAAELRSREVAVGMEVCNTVQESVTKSIPKKKKCKKAKWLSKEALHIMQERREAKKQGRKGKIHPNEC